MKKHKIYLIIIFILVIAFIISVLPGKRDGIIVTQKEPPSSIASMISNTKPENNRLIAESRTNAITEAITRVSPAVVGINVKTIERYRVNNPFLNDPLYRYFFGDQIYEKENASLGSGFIISEDGYILTNEHVIENAQEIQVTLTDGRKFSADVFGSDFLTDIAILKIKGSNFPYIPSGNSDDIIIGEWAIALGNPFGLFDYNNKPTVTVGVISALNINFGATANDRVYQDMIQTDASINPGNSGGPLVNSTGEVIGMNAVIYTGSEYSEGSIGLGFAIPINKVNDIMNELQQFGEIQRSIYTGVSVIDVDKWVASTLKLDEVRGTYIAKVERGSPGDKAGLQKGDVIIEVSGIKIRNREHISNIIRESDLRPGDSLTMKVVRNRRKIEVNLVLGKTN